MTEILSKRGGWFKIEGDVDETSRELILHHKLTMKWSVFLKGYVRGAYESVSRKRELVEGLRVEQEFVQELPVGADASSTIQVFP